MRIEDKSQLNYQSDDMEARSLKRKRRTINDSATDSLSPSPSNRVSKSANKRGKTKKSAFAKCNIEMELEDASRSSDGSPESNSFPEL